MNILHCSNAHTQIHTSTSYPIHEIKTNGINGKAKTTFAVLVLPPKSPNHKTTSSYELVCTVNITGVSFLAGFSPSVFQYIFNICVLLWAVMSNLPQDVLSCIILVPFPVSVCYEWNKSNISPMWIPVIAP